MLFSPCQGDFIILARMQVLRLQGGGIPSAHKNFFQKKYTHARSLVNTTLPACYIYHFTLQMVT